MTYNMWLLLFSYFLIFNSPYILKACAKSNTVDNQKSVLTTIPSDYNGIWIHTVDTTICQLQIRDTTLIEALFTPRGTIRNVYDVVDLKHFSPSSLEVILLDVNSIHTNDLYHLQLSFKRLRDIHTLFVSNPLDSTSKYYLKR